MKARRLLLASKWLRSAEFRLIGEGTAVHAAALSRRRLPVRVKDGGDPQVSLSADRRAGVIAPRTTIGHYDRTVPDCLFCGIAAGEIPATVVLEGKRTIAFRDISPQAPTHVLVVPRDHFADVAALAAEGGGLLDELVGTAHEIAAAEGIEASGYRIVFNTGQDGGQTVGHVHAHVLGGRPMTWPPG
jgi:histidine triad (HIT) family protein